MENHIRVLGLLNIAVGAFTGLAALFQLLFFGGAATLGNSLRVSTVLVGVWLGMILVLLVPCIVAGFALLGFRGWARTFGIVLSVFQLLNVPLGTIVGLYGLWVLFSDGADMIFSGRYREDAIGRR